MRRGRGWGTRENFVPLLKLGIRGISDRVVNASAPGNFGPRVSIFHLIIIVYYRKGEERRGAGTEISLGYDDDNYSREIGIVRIFGIFGKRVVFAE